MGERERRVLRLGERQHGVVARAQVLGEGLTARQIDSRRGRGLWTSVLPGVYRLEGSPHTWLQTVTATVLWAGPTAVLSHRTAATLWGLARFEKTEPIHVTTGTFLPSPPFVTTHQSMLRPTDVVTHAGLKVTSVARTLLDLAATEQPRNVEAAADWAMANRRITAPELRRFVDRHRGHRGIVLLRRLLEGYEGGQGYAESELESRVLEVIDGAGLPRPIRQRAVHTGGRLRRLDFHFEGTPVVIEADGYAWHASRERFEKDRQRANALAARGFVVLHWTWTALEQRPRELVAELVRALGTGHHRQAA